MVPLQVALKPYMKDGKLAVSRKALKRLLSGRDDLTSLSLYHVARRMPGRGRTRGSIRRWQQEAAFRSEMREIARGSGEVGRVRASAKTPEKKGFLAQMKALLGRRGTRGS